MNTMVADCSANTNVLLAYIADLELEVDRLRKQGDFLRGEVRGTLKKIRSLCAKEKNGPETSGIEMEAKYLAAVFRDFDDLPGYHPAHDQVIAIAVRPLIEQVFRWQQRLLAAPQVTLRLELETEIIDWFPARFRHIVDNIVSHCLKYRDPDQEESWVLVGLRSSPGNFELRVTDNGTRLPPAEHQMMFELFYRTAPTRAAGLGVGLAVVKLLVEQSGGQLKVDSDTGPGSTYQVVLPSYKIDDYLSSDCQPE